MRYLTIIAFIMLSTIGLYVPTAGSQMVDRVDHTPGPSGLPLPRFVSLASSEAHMRTGPGQQYPILWTYIRQGLPLEITAEYGNWRRVRDHDGTQGWMHGALLSGVRTAIITGSTRTLYSKPQPDSRVVAQAEVGVQIRLLRCNPGWCRTEIAGQKAWVSRSAIWGTYRGEKMD